MFPMTVTLQITGPDELDFVLTHLKALNTTPPSLAADKAPKLVTPQEDKKPGPKPETAAASAAPPAATPATPEPIAADSGAKSVPPAGGGEPATLDYEKDVRPAFLKLVQTKGRQAGRKIIDAFNPTKEKLSEAITTQEQFAQALDLIAKGMSDA